MGVDVRILQAKWKNLRYTYRRLSKEYKEEGRSGSGQRKSNPPWKHFGVLAFLKDMYTPRQTSGNMGQGIEAVAATDRDDTDIAELSDSEDVVDAASAADASFYSLSPTPSVAERSAGRTPASAGALCTMPAPYTLPPTSLMETGSLFSGSLSLAHGEMPPTTCPPSSMANSWSQSADSLPGASYQDLYPPLPTPPPSRGKETAEAETYRGKSTNRQTTLPSWQEEEKGAH